LSGSSLTEGSEHVRMMQPAQSRLPREELPE
jgi:hypothetical protein